MNQTTTLILLFAILAFTACDKSAKAQHEAAKPLSAAEAGTFKLQSVRGCNPGQGPVFLIGLTNLTGTAIKAFRGTFSKLNDFNEATQICVVEYTSDSDYTQNDQSTRHHIIKPGETIYYGMMNDVLTWFADKPESSPIFKEINCPVLNGRFQFTATKVVTETQP